MNITKYYENKKALDKKIQEYKKNKQLIAQEKNKALCYAHIEKAKHNISFFNKNEKEGQYNDWLTVILYYALYHAALALVTNKNYKSKNHNATLLFIIQQYKISIKEAILIQELAINKEDAELYTTLKRDRQKASYSTNTQITTARIKNYKERVIEFIQKTKEILEV